MIVGIVNRVCQHGLPDGCMNSFCGGIGNHSGFPSPCASQGTWASFPCFECRSQVVLSPWNLACLCALSDSRPHSFVLRRCCCWQHDTYRTYFHFQGAFKVPSQCSPRSCPQSLLSSESEKEGRRTLVPRLSRAVMLFVTNS